MLTGLGLPGWRTRQHDGHRDEEDKEEKEEAEGQAWGGRQAGLRSHLSNVTAV